MEEESKFIVIRSVFAWGRVVILLDNSALFFCFFYFL